MIISTFQLRIRYNYNNTLSMICIRVKSDQVSKDLLPKKYIYEDW